MRGRAFADGLCADGGRPRAGTTWRASFAKRRGAFRALCVRGESARIHAQFSRPPAARETFAAGADQIAVRLTQGLCGRDQILWTAELSKARAAWPFPPANADIDRFAGARIETGIEHAGGQRSRRGVKILHLLGLMVDIAQVFGQLDGGGKVAAGWLEIR